MAHGEPGAIVDAFGCHLVGIVLRWRYATEEPSAIPRIATYSSTIIRFENYMFLLTAGHVINKINADYASSYIVVDRCALIDNFGYAAKHSQVVPFAWMASRRYAFDEEGLDIGLVSLDQLTTSSLIANGIRPVEEENWRHQHTVKFDGHFLLGLPDELTPERMQPGGGMTLSPVGTPLVAIDGVLHGIAAKTHPQFFASLRQDAPPLESIVGMSGGPIVGVRIDPGPSVRYWVVAVQSGWYPERRLIYASPVPYFASQLADEFRRQMTSDKEAD